MTDFRDASARTAAAALIAAFLPMAGCSSTKPSAPSGEEWRFTQTTSSARTAFDRGELAQAATLYQLALNQARAAGRDDLAAEAAYNLAACLSVRGDQARAAVLLDESAALRSGDAHFRNDVRLLSAAVARRRGAQYATQGIQSAHAVTASDSGASALQRMLASCLLGEFAADAAPPDAASAATQLRTAESLRPADAPPAAAARVAHLSARVQDLSGNSIGAARSFESAAILLREAHLGAELPGVWAEAGGAFQRAGDLNMAASCFERAARCAVGLGEAAGARPLLERAAALAARTGDTGMSGRIAALAAELPAP